MTKIQSIYAFFAMAAIIGGAAFSVFRWMDNRTDAETESATWQQTQAEWMIEQTLIMDDLAMNVDTAIMIGKSNSQAIQANYTLITTNREFIIDEIKSDTSQSIGEAIEKLEELYNQLEEIKKNGEAIHYGYQF